MTDLRDAPADGSIADLDELRRVLSDLGRVVVAFSGGADSAFLAWVTRDTLGAGNVTTVTAVSPSLPSVELADCAALVEEWDLRWEQVHTDEIERAAYRRNDIDRCFHCKDALMDALVPLARETTAHIVLGVNVDDLGDHRPGQRAAAERNAVFPLVDAGFTKRDIREHSRLLGLRTWDKPAAACLASRVPYGTPVTLGLLDTVERAEAALAALGFRELRIRHYGDLARIEVPLDRISDLMLRREDVVTAVRGAGYRYVTVDLEGLRSGNLNEGHV